MSYKKIAEVPPPESGEFLGLDRAEAVPEVWSAIMYWRCVRDKTIPHHFPVEGAKRLTHWAVLPALPEDEK